jgi:hypothetical protein
MSARALLGASVLMLVTGEAWAQAPVLHPNAQPYSIKSPAAATGRAGNAQLAVRALRSKSGETTLEVTTGQLDGGAPSVGNITKLQFKTYNGLGELSGTRNYTGLSNTGSLQYTFTELVVGQPFQTQANIKGIDGKRTDVVTVTGTVKMRPDLAVRDLGLPQRARIGAPVNVLATIAEIQGEVGARANCVLRVDGVIVDRADGIWVDGGDTVSCLFTHQFTSTGTKNVSVALESVVPADDDPDNDAAASQIEIIGAGMPLDGYRAQFTSTAASSSGWRRGWYRAEGAPPYYDSGGDWDYQWVSSDRREKAIAEMRGSERIGFPLDVTVTETADAIAFPMLSRSDVNADEYWGDAVFGGESVVLHNVEWNAFLWVDSYRNADVASTHVQYERNATQATYLGSGYEAYWYQYAGDIIGRYHYAHGNSETQSGRALSPTTTYAISFDIVPISGGGGGLSVAIDVPLVASSQRDDKPAECVVRPRTDLDPLSVHESCEEHHATESGVSGAAKSPE